MRDNETVDGDGNNGIRICRFQGIDEKCDLIFKRSKKICCFEMVA